METIAERLLFRRMPVAVFLVVLVAAAGIVTSPAEAKKRKTRRVVETPYAEPAIGAAGLGLCFQGSSCVFVQPLPGERSVAVEIDDQLGLPVPASVIQDTSGDGSYLATDDYTVHICGKTAEPIKIHPELTVTVWVWRGPGVVPPCPGIASSGTVTTTFSKGR